MFWTDDFKEDDEPVEKSSFETATAAAQLKFTGVPWTTEQMKDQMHKIMDFHRTIVETVDFDALHAHVHDSLPAYARPLFLRLQRQTDTTGTFKFRKVDLFLAFGGKPTVLI